MNQIHEPPGSYKGGRFASKSGVCIRNEDPTMDMKSYFQKIQDETDENNKKEYASKALYDGGYTINKENIEDIEETEHFLRKITTSYKETGAWLNRKDYVKNYLMVVSGYVTNGKYDVVTNGHYSGSSRKRNAEEIIGEFNLTKDDVGKIIQEQVTADDFMASGINSSSYIANTGTVVMEFAPRVTLYKESMTPNGPKRRKFTVDLYLKTVLNPHPDISRDQNTLQILSIKEANSKVLLYSGKERKSREEWKKDKKNPNNPQMEKRGKNK